MQSFIRHTLLPAVIVLLLMAGAGYGAWQWVLSQPVSEVEVLGAKHAEVDSLRALARVDTSATLRESAPRILEGRVVRHPWVREASVTRWPTGNVVIRVRERTPVALALDTRGVPDYYLDRRGFQMPLTPDGVYDVPLLQGFDGPRHPTRPAEDEVLRGLLQTIAEASGNIDALVSGFEQDASGDVIVHTAPVDNRGSLAATLGREAFPERLSRLHAFIDQAVRQQPDVRFDSIDLRFDDQIVARQERKTQP